MGLPFELSDNRRRGHMPHIRSKMDALQHFSGKNIPCEHCRRSRATKLKFHLGHPMAICSGCSEDLLRLGPVATMEAITRAVRRRP